VSVWCEPVNSSIVCPRPSETSASGVFILQLLPHTSNPPSLALQYLLFYSSTPPPTPSVSLIIIEPLCWLMKKEVDTTFLDRYILLHFIFHVSISHFTYLFIYLFISILWPYGAVVSVTCNSVTKWFENRVHETLWYEHWGINSEQQ